MLVLFFLLVVLFVGVFFVTVYEVGTVGSAILIVS